MSDDAQRSWVRGFGDFFVVAALGVLGALLPMQAQAQEQTPPTQGQGHRGPPRQPPPEAFTACESHNNGDACTVSFHGNEITGTCMQFPEGQRLFCRPTHMPPPPSGQQGPAPQCTGQ